MTTIAVLRTIPLLAPIPLEILELLAGHCVSRRFERGETIWRQGGEATAFTFMESGHLKVVKQRRDGNETILGLFHQGDAVGQVAVQQGMPYPAMAVALTDVVIVAIPRDVLLAVMRDYPPLQASMVGDMTRRARDLVTRIDELTAAGAEQRLAGLFVTLTGKLGGPNGEGMRIDLGLSRQELADLINMRVETVSRIMSRWNKDGVVRTEPDGFLIEDLALVERLAANVE